MSNLRRRKTKLTLGELHRLVTTGVVDSPDLLPHRRPLGGRTQGHPAGLVVPSLTPVSKLLC